MNQQYVSPTNTLGKKKKKNNLLGGARAMEYISDLPEEVGYTPGPSPVGVPGIADKPTWEKSPQKGTTLQTQGPESLNRSYGGGPGAGGPGFVPTKYPTINNAINQPIQMPIVGGAYGGGKGSGGPPATAYTSPPSLQQGGGSGLTPLPALPIPADKRQLQGPIETVGSGAPQLPEFYTDPPNLTNDEIKKMNEGGVVFGEGGVPSIPEGMGGLLGTGTQAQMRKEALDKVGMAGMIEPEFEDVLGTVEVGTDTIVPTTSAMASLSGQPTEVGGGTVTQPPQQTQTPTQIQTGAGDPETGTVGLELPVDKTRDPEGLAGGKGSQFVDFAATATKPEGVMTLAEYKEKKASGEITTPERMTPEDELDILDPLSQEKIYGETAPGYAGTEQQRQMRDQMIVADNISSKKAAQVNVSLQTLKASGGDQIKPENYSEGFTRSKQFGDMMNWFAADKETRATMSHPLANLEIQDTPMLDELGNPIMVTDPVSGKKVPQTSRELTPESQDAMAAYGKLLANEQTRADVARQYNITNLNAIGETIDPDTGERVPTDVALSRQTALANSLSSIAGQTFTPTEAAAYERGEVSEELKTKLDASWAQVQKEQEQEIARMEAETDFTVAGAEEKRADIERRKGELQLAKDELAWRKTHSAAELTERGKAREAEMGRLQAELTSVATREADQRTHEQQMATSSRAHEQQMATSSRAHETEMAKLQQETQFATQAMNMLSSNPSAIFALQTTPGLESLAALMGIARQPTGIPQGAQPQGLIPTVGSLQQGGQQAMQRAQTMAGLQQGLTPGDFAQQVRSVTPGGGFAPGVQEMTGITRTGRG